MGLLFNILVLLAAYVAGATAQVNPITRPIRNVSKQVHVRRFAQIPNGRDGRPSRIVGIVPFRKNLFVTTSTSDALIYKVTPAGRAFLWFDVNATVRAQTGRSVSAEDTVHGGVRGIAFHPKYSQNGLFYVSIMEDRGGQPTSNFRYFSLPSNPISADSVVLEFRANLVSGVPIPSSLREVIRIGMPVFDHPIKQIAFYKKFLYITHGDGSVQSAVVGGGQNDDGLGKILRINPLRKGSSPYRVPSSNPVISVNGITYKRELYAIGFRNPHNLCFSRSGELFVADVGRDNVEEIDLVKPGGNYGWALREGPFVHLQSGGIGTGVEPLPANEAPRFEYPVAAFGHEGPSGDRFVGQAVAGSCPIENGSPLSGRYLYANFGDDGDLYFSFLSVMRKAVTFGRPNQLTMARTYRPRIFFDDDDDPRTPAVQVANLRDIVRRDTPSAKKANLRFGRDKDGTIYWSSKSNGRIYQITSSKPGAAI